MIDPRSTLGRERPCRGLRQCPVTQHFPTILHMPPQIGVGAVGWLAMRKIGGQTGDVCGAGQVLAETAMLAVYAATISLP